jgi:pimeloyl-ACP methyl ester carboxylesterase
MCRRFIATAVFVVAILVHGEFAGADIQFRSTGNNGKIILLVHGLWGDPMSSFGEWPLLIVNDRTTINGQSLSQYSVAAVGYPAARADRLTPRQAALNLLGDVAREVRAGSYKEVFIIAHSLGGIVIKQMLSDALARSPDLVERTRAVFLIATPTRGSNLANFAKYLPLTDSIAGNMVQYLQTEDGHRYLLDLSDSWEGLTSGNNPSVTFAKYCAFETGPMRFLRIPTTVIVPQVESEVGCTQTHVANNEDHVSIVKPATVDAPIHMWVRGLILQAAARPGAQGRPAGAAQSSHCQAYGQGQRFSVGGYGFFGDLAYSARVERDDCQPMIAATVEERGKAIEYGGHSTDSCSEHHHFNTLTPGMRISIPRTCVNRRSR